MFSRIKALLFLALGLFKTLLMRWGADRNLQAFREHYGSENIIAVSTVEAKLLARAVACTACGRCDAFEGERVAVSQGAYRGMMAFVLAGTRSLPDHGRTAASIADIPDDAFLRAEQECPESVPLLSLAELVRRHAARLS